MGAAYRCKGSAGVNVDSTEIEKFGAMAQDWWDDKGPLRTLHQINPVRLEFIRRGCGGRLEGLRVVDVGCGAGILSEAMARAGAKVLGVDLAESALAAARKHAEQGDQDLSKTLEYRAIAVEDLAAEAAGSFDVVTCMEMLEHVPEPQSVVRACAKLLRPGGQVFFATINRNPKSYLLAILGAEYVLGLIPRGTHDYEKLIRPSELLDMARTAGLQLEELKGMHYDPIRGRARLVDDVSVNYLCRSRRVDSA
ncbi:MULTISPECIES: bifunctional 2-polyprenyl-6-hydroxyphenol methylase/3-demethylubiquinol 3-O-methyltransferase UbiG [Acidithiobacillus]|jgi:2-polyprenyl-6-hydroxyphenyl methylase/3-demethylubiquinone-9 3-methyltransferase|uniref:Ubiquinone biosynthesis O-methyltransferase n=1 Tax=Acidithiobacillus caldus TaxID=33059 RepID=A0A1E7YLC7_9PROT|nr:bifunctional 2-polyprenyl-6-hydroxyphenol methylase/3-demethylubiquinol 3-O-methyltransferase UbiG [Acidithiobacillus caldus]OFC32722.1 bifunctional 3-demethylubiquinol 3-O-methyltransferase/2-polyprenyl-6-hydroxyphenol methylase [Acidithiobacillus caldus]OFC37363.1 bifunctional 3-demethylubiquinol 3-O-methyltransferase/2-polyprenyl-6-hydroxyphenol methylase [Acidithiobacillus caldus]OFC40327.1 bifunctional 3-demethylubiquinol 3-O-methyltransferase/2-polyprenyl-6-hydroxyphenol methylase [Acid